MPDPTFAEQAERHAQHLADLAAQEAAAVAERERLEGVRRLASTDPREFNRRVDSGALSLDGLL